MNILCSERTPLSPDASGVQYLCNIHREMSGNPDTPPQQAMARTSLLTSSGIFQANLQTASGSKVRLVGHRFLVVCDQLQRRFSSCPSRAIVEQRNRHLCTLHSIVGHVDGEGLNSSSSVSTKKCNNPY